MITADKFYTCDDAGKIAERVVSSLPSVNSVQSVVPYGMGGYLESELGPNGTAELWFFDMLSPVAVNSGIAPKENVFIGDLVLSIVPFKFPVTTGVMSYKQRVVLNCLDEAFICPFRVSEGAVDPDFNNPLLTSAPVTVNYKDVMISAIDVQLINGLNTTFGTSISWTFQGYKVQINYAF